VTITREQAIEIHAKALRAGHGLKAATTRALAQAFRCRAKGDLEGFEVWLQVRDALKRQAAGAGTETIY
jgi:hypothetical protein